MPSTGRLYHPLALDAVEDIEEYRLGGYHPVHLADTYHERYKILHKLGSGGFSTTWLTRDTVGERYAALKILKAEETEACSELSVLERITELRTDHPGQKHVRTLIDQFSIRGPNGCHICLVTDVAGPSLHDLYNIVGAGFIAGARRLRTENARSVIKQVVDAVDFLHSNKICHGGKQTFSLLLLLFLATDCPCRPDHIERAIEARVHGFLDRGRSLPKTRHAQQSGLNDSFRFRA